MNEEQIAFCNKVRDTIGSFDAKFMEANERERMEIAEQLMLQVDWVRFRAGMDKECFPCRAQNPNDARKCWKCEAIIVCDDCLRISGGRVWRCSHAPGVRMAEATKTVVKMHETQRNEPRAREPDDTPRKPPPSPRFTLD